MTERTIAATGPHGAIRLEDERSRFVAQLFDRLWDRYRERVQYVRQYEQVVQQHGGKFVNDHIAFRTIAWQQPYSGISTLSRLFETLGYRAAGLYYFEDKHLFATHFHPPHEQLPKLFISELQPWKLSERARTIIGRSLESARAALAIDELVQLQELESGAKKTRAALLENVVAFIETLPWNPPAKEDVVALNEESQYGAWVLVHGNNVNHFTSLINSHGVSELDNIEKTSAALREAGVPMKEEIEGSRGSMLRQTATQAVVIDVDVHEAQRIAKMPWTYAYFELAERGDMIDSDGTKRRFEGFLGPQATQLFEMTRKK